MKTIRRASPIFAKPLHRMHKRRLHTPSEHVVGYPIPTTAPRVFTASYVAVLGAMVVALVLVNLSRAIEVPVTCVATSSK